MLFAVLAFLFTVGTTNVLHDTPQEHHQRDNECKFNSRVDDILVQLVEQGVNRVSIGDPEHRLRLRDCAELGYVIVLSSRRTNESWSL